MGIILPKSPAAAMRVMEWCKANIAPQEYYVPWNAGIKAGGEGWEVIVSGKNMQAVIEDPQMQTFFCIAFQNS